MFYAKMNDEDDELPRYEEEEEGLEQPHEGELIEEGEEVIEVETGEEEPEAPRATPPARKPARPAAKKAKKSAPKKAKAKAKPATIAHLIHLDRERFVGWGPTTRAGRTGRGPICVGAVAISRSLELIVSTQMVFGCDIRHTNK